ncbi:MAG TPA: OmpW family outer membrane protein [Gammaproteobacteria bacterium]|nr:OmpW family outer membrane protein [Gammaproteobacteria bacterium]
MSRRLTRTLFPAAAGIAVAAGLGLSATAASARPLHAGDWLVRVGVSDVNPNESTSNPRGGLPPGSDVSIDSDTRPSFTVGYMYTDNLGVEVLAALPFSHDIRGAGTLAPLGTIGELKQLPPTISLDWHFLPASTIRPYVGAGVNYTYFFDEHARGALSGTNLKLDNSFGAAAQVGVDMDITPSWYLNANVRYIQIETTATYGNGYQLDVNVNPWVYTLAVGTTF